MTPPYYGEVTGFTTEISNGGIWNVTDDSFVNTLNMQGNASIIGTDKVKQFNADEIVVSGAGNKLMFNKDTVLGAQVILKKDAELTTHLDTVFDYAQENGVVTQGGAIDVDVVTDVSTNPDGSLSTTTEKRPLLQFEEGSSLRIEDAVAYSSTGLNGIASAYENMNLVIDNATLQVIPDDTGNMNIPTNVNITLGARGEADLAGGATAFNVAGIVNIVQKLSLIHI